MDGVTLVTERLAAHLLTAPAPSLVEAASRLAAAQGQDFAGVRWALAVRTTGEPTIADVDRAFDEGSLVRSWTMRGTLHAVPARDLVWMLSVTGERMWRAAAARRVALGLRPDVLARAERGVLSALRGGNALTRAEVFAVLEGEGIDPASGRGYHVLMTLAVRGLVCWGPVVARSGGLTREQRIVRVDEWVTDAAAPADPTAELFARYVEGHGPATIADFVWWSGVPVTVSRAAAAAAEASGRVQVDPGGHWRAASPASTDVPGAPLIALPPFDEYYLSYADRSVTCPPEWLARVGPGKNGMVKAVVVRGGRVVGTWRPADVSAGEGAAGVELFESGDDLEEELVTELDRYRRFVAP